MKTLNCEHCNKMFVANTEQYHDSSRDANGYVPCGSAWSITYYEGGVVHYREAWDHEPNQGYENSCYKCKPHYKDEGY